MSKRVIYLLLALSLGLNIGVIATTLIHRSSGPGGGPPSGPGGNQGPLPGQPPDPARLVEDHLRGMTDHLDLDASQQREIRSMLEQHAEELNALQIAAADAGRHLAVEFAAPVFDPRLFLRLTADASTARSQLDSLSAVILIAEAAALTPEQRLKYSAVAPTIHSQPQQPPPADGPPPR